MTKSLIGKRIKSHTAKKQETKNKTLLLGNRIYSFALT